MKKLILLLLFIPLVSFGQISISDLIKVAKMDRESFEIYALENGYRYWKPIKEDGYEGLLMEKDNRNEGLGHYSMLNKSLKSDYMGPQEGLVSIYKELKNLGFTLFETQEAVVGNFNRYSKIYKKDDEQVTITIINNDLSIQFHKG